MLRPTAGSIQVLGGIPGHGTAQLRKVGFVAQETPVYAGLSVADHLKLGRRMNARWDAEFAASRIQDLKLDPRRKAGRMSGGQRAQLALTIALARHPDLLILDEPVASLDPLARREFLEGLAEATSGLQMSVVMSSHLVSDLERICDYLVVLVASRIQVAGPVADVLADHYLVSGPGVDRSGVARGRGAHQRGAQPRPDDSSGPGRFGSAASGLDRDEAEPGRRGPRLHGPGRRDRRGWRGNGGSTMTWLTFRQFRAQAITALAAVAVLAAAYGYTGPHLGDLYNKTGLSGCGTGPHCLSLASTFMNAVRSDQVYPALFFAGFLILLILPAVIGAFWGAPLVARELEAGTFRLAWSQDVTRTRWMAVKLGLIGLAAIATSGLISLLFSWWAGPINAAGGFPDNLSQFARITPLMFVAQGIAPVGWAALAFVIGVVTGILVRRTVSAMAITIVVVALLQFLWPHFIRPHLQAPARITAPVTIEGLNSMVTSHSGGVGVAVNQPGTLRLPGAWVLSNYTVTPAGTTFHLPGSPSSVCARGSARQCEDWIVGQHLTQVVEYQPASNFWPLQWTETAVLLIIAAGLGGVATWRTRRLVT